MGKRWTEAAYGSGKVDREAGLIRGVKVLGLQSRNRRSYLPEATRRAVGLYEGAPVYIDHPDPQSTGTRSFRDRWAILENVRADESGELWGDVKYLKTHPMTETILESAELFPDTFGLSHNAEGEDEMRNGSAVVTEISKVYSVDLVADPATNKGLFEGVQTMKKKLSEAVAGSVLAPVFARLIENEGYDDMPGMEMEVSEDTPEAHLDAALSLMVQKIIADKSLDMAGKLEQFRKVLEMQAAMETVSEPSPEMVAEMEQMKEENAKMKESLARIESEGKCRELLESLDRDPTPARIKALVACADADRKSIAESWPARGEVHVDPSKRPSVSPGRLQEGTISYPKSIDEFTRAVRG